MTNTDTHLKNGDVSAYGFACGYVQIREFGPTVPDKIARRVHREMHGEDSPIVVPRFQVRMDFNGCTYDVKVWDFRPDDGRDMSSRWEQVDTLGEARALFRSLVREYSAA